MAHLPTSPEAEPKSPQVIARELNLIAETDDEKVEFLAAIPFAKEALHKYRLGNGLIVMLLEDRSAPVATYFTWFKVGSRHEKPGKTGLAHLFEHLMFNATEGRPPGSFDRILEEHGAESNAATWTDWTYYYESLPSESIGLAVTLESERMSRLVLRDTEVSSEKEVVSNERRMVIEDDVEGAASELLYKTAFTRHPYRWPTIGWMDDIQGFSPEDCNAFYRTYYAPNNATVVIVGDFEPFAILKEIQKGYGKLPASQIPAEDYEPEPPQVEPRVTSIEKPTQTEKVIVAFRSPPLGSPDHVLLSLVNEILTGGRASRLHRRLVTELELASELRGWVSTFRDSGLYDLFVTAREGHTAKEIEAVIYEELEKLRRELVTEEELSRAKARHELSALQSLETMSGKAEQIGFYETVLGDPVTAFRRLEACNRATVSDLRRVARQYLSMEGRNVVYVLPDGSDPEGGEECDDVDGEGEEAAE